MPLSCRLKPAARCSDRPRYEQNACLAATHCADVIDWTAASCIDVRQPGPYHPGVRIMPFTKDSVASPGTPRLLNTVVWYPTNVSGPLSSFYDAVLDAPLEGAAAPYPVLLFSHGSCGAPQQSRFLTALLATYGFIVIAPPHPGNTIGEFPTCSSPTALVASLQERPQDMLFVLDQMLLESANPISPFLGALDPTRIGMAGHSFGGLTTYLTTPLDPRIKVAMPMAAAVLGNPVLPVPSLTMLGQVDSVVNNAGILSAYAAAATPKYLIGIEHAGHYAFSDGCFPGPDCNFPTTLSQSEAHDIVLRWAVPFLQRHLAGDPSYASFLTAAPPGVLFAAEQ
jgi:predicted dienelactone hydrolase